MEKLGLLIIKLKEQFDQNEGADNLLITAKLLVKELHQHLGAKHYLKSDFVLTPRGKIHLLQIDVMPDLKPNSHFSQVVESVGAKMHHVVEHMLENVL